MPIHFERPEFDARQARATAALRAAGLDAILLFAPESHLWLTGYDTFGFAMFQTMVLSADGEINLMTRMPDLRQARHTSTLAEDQITIWPEHEGSNPATHLKDLLARMGLTGKRIGFESQTAGLTDYNGQLLRAALPSLIDASDLIRALRRIKSPAEITMHRRAAALSDDALDAAIDTTHAGAFEGDILAAMQGAVFKGGGDYAGNEFILGSGPGALLCRYYSGRRTLDAQDQLTLEWSGAYARYHAAMMRTVVIGAPNASQTHMFDAAKEAIEACEDAIRPGDPMGNVFDAHAKVFDARGLGHARLQACGYGMGAVYNPIWVDFPMFYEGNPLPMQAGQVFFLHMILMDSDAGLAMTLGHSVLVTETGVERLSRSPLEMLTA
ncbi:Xaa-Pro peptidase family protein [Roseovarius sp. LXJ103]|uniref:M24 family metallopeptidase n=1 Tax=Roseovarius carneus TaxID=2853164 RepID=UPI000D605FA0|nr:Xaa-Pro peptidase family protein [Roseovarius carneus]MBZ8119239.1 Xaa-Pro peptidase family protein [Roseovarius carneus]PWE35136.1 Xaa-Pro dipeptidase [Pelagicola sp. LXJ1103]